MNEVLKRTKRGDMCCGHDRMTDVKTENQQRKKYRVLGGRSPELKTRLLLAVFVTGEWRNTG